MKLLIFVAFLAALASAAKVDYTGHMVIRVTPKTQFQLGYLMKMQEQTYDFWAAPSKVDSHVDIRLSPQQYLMVVMKLRNLGLSHTVHIADVGKLIDQEEKNVLLRRAIYSGKAIDLENYHRYAEIVAHVNDVAATSNIVTAETIGTTHEGRDIIMAKVSSGPGKQIMYFECAMHAREWITPATCLWILNELTTKYGTDPEITDLVDFADWYITPVSNPDGYEYTWTNNRLWRKNRQPNAGSTCMGTDPNRNFAAGFGLPGASNLACSDTYHGPSAFSTQEAAAFRDVLAANRGRFIAAITIHSYSQLWMSPYGYTATSLPADYTEQYRVMTIAVNALTATYGTRFTYGDTANTIYVASGVSSDHAYDNEGIVHSYSLELRDTGVYGFELPPSQIAATATETFNGLKAMVKEIQAAPSKSLRKSVV